MVDLIDTNGVKPTLKKGVLGYDDYSVGGDAGRLYVGTGTASIAQAKKSELDSHTSNVSNPHSVTKTQVGLENVDNTSDANKPVSTATQTALNTKVDKITSTNNALPKFNGTTGALQNSGVIIDDSNNVGIGLSNPSAKIHSRVNSESSAIPAIVLENFINGNPQYGNGARLAYNINDNGNPSLTKGSIDVINTYYGAKTKMLFSTYNSGLINSMELDSSGNLLLTSGTGALGYGTGAGGTVTQLTSKSTAVTLNKPTGTIITSNSTLAAGATAEFVFNNSLISGSDTIAITANSTNYRVAASSHRGNSTFVICITNVTGLSLSDSIYIDYSIIKGANA